MYEGFLTALKSPGLDSEQRLMIKGQKPEHRGRFDHQTVTASAAGEASFQLLLDDSGPWASKKGDVFDGIIKIGSNSVYVSWTVTVTSDKSASPVFDECASKPCLNGGTCLESGTSSLVAAGHFVCSNAPGYSGARGETDVDECASAPCLNGGTCAESGTAGGAAVAPNAFSCANAPGFSGGRGETDVDECASSPCAVWKTFNKPTCVDSRWTIARPVQHYYDLGRISKLLPRLE